ncbi:MAG TPA: D-arabinono-1,4-lactone oxidase [Ktedonobacteraceae bacterium]|nr:D-arabinono-1,4-lactone oxidase [Ktedonobacteraceae bacterium]
MEISQAGQWSNWSGSVKCTPIEVVRPRGIDELAKVVEECGLSGRHLRVAGSGHSFTPIAQSNDILLSLENMQGIESIDSERGVVTILGGTVLRNLGERLFEHGLAQENLGDIDVQTISGAISTGTHGTGIRFGTLSTQVVGLTLITASGEILECSLEREPEIFKAAQVSLGTLGVIAKVKLRVVPAKRLHYLGQRKDLADCLAHMEQYKQENSHFEFLWFPYTGGVQAKFLNETTEPVSKSTLLGNINKLVLENYVYWLLSESCRLFPNLCKTVSNISAQSIATIDEVNYSHRLFTTPRMVRFQEMEYNIPAEYAVAVINEIKECIQRRQFRVHFPLECRFVHSDDIWLSPAYGRESAYIAVHMYRGMPYRSYFYYIEEIFKRYQGRPHWGKMHTRTAGEMAELYPHWHDFRRVRAALDPQGVFLNSYLRDLFDADKPLPSNVSGVPGAVQEEQSQNSA